ncbi:hypothetical protein [Paracoccus sp. (in: a-proteobacteria)]|uniref:hypothetical protein n=1 Tax=Paracoccus sp. TaxID=267 RepID=UPI0035B24296
MGIALAQHTNLEVLAVHGTYDLVTSYFMSRFVLAQVMRAKGSRERLFLGTHAGGDMVYLRAASRAEFAASTRPP